MNNLRAGCDENKEAKIFRTEIVLEFLVELDVASTGCVALRFVVCFVLRCVLLSASYCVALCCLLLVTLVCWLKISWFSTTRRNN